MGLNVNLAPVLDVYGAAGDFIDQDQRSYSNQAPVVAACGRAFITAQQKTALAGALEAGRLNRAAFNAAMQRITALRSAL